MIKLTNKQYSTLKPYEKHLSNAVYGDYLYGVTLSIVSVITDVYNEVYKKKESVTNCSKCRLRIFKAVGKLYFEHYKELSDRMENARKEKKRTKGEKKNEKISEN